MPSQRERQYGVPKGQCVTGKRVYYAERLANRAVSKAATRGELDPLRHYKCPECDYWHLSRKKAAVTIQLRGPMEEGRA